MMGTDIDKTSALKKQIESLQLKSKQISEQIFKIIGNYNSHSSILNSTEQSWVESYSVSSLKELENESERKYVLHLLEERADLKKEHKKKQEELYKILSDIKLSKLQLLLDQVSLLEEKL